MATNAALVQTRVEVGAADDACPLAATQKPWSQVLWTPGRSLEEHQFMRDPLRT